MDIITISLGSILTFEYDPKKSVANLQKHGIDFDEAQQLWEGIYIKAPARKEESDDMRWSASCAESIGRRSRPIGATAFESSR